jgi:hypothetical protein
MFELRLEPTSRRGIQTTQETCGQRITTGNPEHVETTQRINGLQSHSRRLVIFATRHNGLAAHLSPARTEFWSHRSVNCGS